MKKCYLAYLIALIIAAIVFPQIAESATVGRWGAIRGDGVDDYARYEPTTSILHDSTHYLVL